MKWTTANLKSPNYTENHEIYVGTNTGSFKKLMPAYEKNPFEQKNLLELSNLTKESRIQTLEFGNVEKSEILVGRGTNNVQLYSLRREVITQSLDLPLASVVGFARFDEHLVTGHVSGQIQRFLLPNNADQFDQTPTMASDTLSHDLKSGDNISHLRQCKLQRNLVATGGKERQNNLKVFDMEVGKQIFTSKNLPNDYLQLEVPIWDSDVGFIDATNTLATCSRYGYVRVYDIRKQRRPVQCYATEDQMSFATLIANGNYIYTGTTMGALKAFDIRCMKNFVHTYKGFTGAISDLYLDESGKYLCSASLDRYVRVHHVDSCVMLYQCYVKSKATRILLRESMENPNSVNQIEDKIEEDAEEIISVKTAHNDAAKMKDKDEEYEQIFDSMQTVREVADDDDDDEDDGDDDDDNDDDDENDDNNEIVEQENGQDSTVKTDSENSADGKNFKQNVKIQKRKIFRNVTKKNKKKKSQH